MENLFQPRFAKSREEKYNQEFLDLEKRLSEIQKYIVCFIFKKKLNILVSLNPFKIKFKFRTCVDIWCPIPESSTVIYEWLSHTMHQDIKHLHFGNCHLFNPEMSEIFFVRDEKFIRLVVYCKKIKLIKIKV